MNSDSDATALPPLVRRSFYLLMSEIYFGFQSIEQKVSKLLKPILANDKIAKKEVLIINNLVKNWDKVVGEKYALVSYPKSVQLAKKSEFGAEAKLTIAVFNSSAAFALKNSSELILERIAMLYGYRAIHKIIIKQEPKENDLAEVEIILNAKQKEELDKKFKDVENQDLASVLKKIDTEFTKLK